MIKSYLIAAVVLIQALVLLCLGLYLICYAESLMTILIFLVGEERALGESNVIRTERGVFLTNPGAMVLWMMPFLVLGFIQIAASVTLVWLWIRGRPALTGRGKNADMKAHQSTQPSA